MSNDKDDVWTRKKEQWELVRKAVEHEDIVFNHRLTWLLLMQGFLITIFALGQGAVLSGKPSMFSTVLLEGVLAVVLYAGFRCCAVIARTLALAGEHQVHLREWWMQTYADERRAARILPADSGQQGERRWYVRWLACLVERDSGWWKARSIFRYSLRTDAPAVETIPPTPFPPVHGHFDVPGSNNVMIARYFKWVNGLLAGCCFAIALAALFGWHAGSGLSGTIERKDATSGSSYKATFESAPTGKERDKLQQKLIDELTK